MCPPASAVGSSPTVLIVAHSLALERVAAQVAGALAAEGVVTILLKGAVLDRWLHADGPPRAYGDVDLLVAPADLERARRTVERLGHRGEDVVDLTDRLNGTGLDPREAWPLLRADAEPIEVGGATVLGLGPAGRALHVALHAWWHGGDEPRPLDDLSRALAVCTPGDWERALVLARELRAVEGFAGGLELVPAGREVRVRLGLPAPGPPPATPLATARPVERAIDALRRTAGLRGRGFVLARMLVPPRGEMRMRYPVARRGRRGLAAAHALRAARRTAELPPALLAAARRRRL
jgi:hypothetical protein